MSFAISALNGTFIESKLIILLVHVIKVKLNKWVGKWIVKSFVGK